jgi:predicted DCC family thiol-disulfide oxidoreductase YuxK
MVRVCVCVCVCVWKGLLLRHKENGTLSFVGKHMELEINMLKEIGQSHKDKYHMFSLIRNSLSIYHLSSL